jgi:hypothetical protein
MTSALERLGIDPSAKFDFVLDTNAFLDIASIHDVAPFLGLEASPRGRLARASGLILDVTPFIAGRCVTSDEPSDRYRITRAAAGALLAAAFHEHGCRTLQLRGESFDKLTESAPPFRAAIDGVAGFPQIVGHFLMDYVLPRWRAHAPTIEEAVASTACDDLLLGAAIELAVPLVTNEGWGPSGASDGDRRKLRRKARDAGVAVFTTDEALNYLRVDRGALAQAFMMRLRSAIPNFLSNRAVARTDWRGWRAALESFETYYQGTFALAVQPHCVPRQPRGSFERSNPPICAL